MIIVPSNSMKPDPYWDRVSLLMHMEGAHGSGTYIDSSKNAFPLTNSGSAISSDTKVFGSTSGYFNGVNSQILVPDSGLWTLGGDFTVELWAFPTSGANISIITGQWGSGYSWAFVIIPGNFSGLPNILPKHYFEFTWFVGGVQGGVVGSSSSSQLPLNTWTHLAVTRAGSTVRLFVNGVMDATTVTESSAFDNSADYLRLGSGGGGNWYQGYIDELRITNGVARYVNSFSVPNKSFWNA